MVLSHMRIAFDVPHPVILADGIKGKLLRWCSSRRGICKLFRVSTRKMYAREQKPVIAMHTKTKRMPMNDTTNGKRHTFMIFSW